MSEIELRTWRGDIDPKAVNHIFIAYGQACYPSSDKAGRHNSRWAVLYEKLRDRFHSLQSTRISAGQSLKKAGC